MPSVQIIIDKNLLNKSFLEIVFGKDNKFYYKKDLELK
jgi:hypothetical protein